MKDKITAPNGTRIVLDDVCGYRVWSQSDECYSMSIYLKNKCDEVISFESEEELKAFLARLDKYFQEIP